MKVLVTGGGGFLGLHIVKKLLEQGHQVSNLSRGHYPNLEEMGVSTFQGSLADLEVLKNAVQNQEVVFHVASKVAMWGAYSDFYETNVIGTKNLLKVSKESGIKHFIYTSTPSVVFGEHSIIDGDESLPYPQKSYSKYARTKAIAEKAVLAANCDSFQTLSLRPHLIFGPGDQNLIPRLVEAAKKKKLKIIGDAENKVDVIYVENAADAHLCALNSLAGPNNECAGKAFFIGQGPVLLWPFINNILERHQLPPIKKSMSFKKAFFIGSLIEFILSVFRINNVHPPMTRFVALQLAKSHFFKHDRANQDLGWKPKISIDEALSNIAT